MYVHIYMYIHVYIYSTMIIIHSREENLVLHKLRIHAFVFSRCSFWPENCFKRWHLMHRYSYPAGFCCGCPERPFYGRSTLTLELWSQCNIWNFVTIYLYISYYYMYITSCPSSVVRRRPSSSVVVRRRRLSSFVVVRRRPLLTFLVWSNGLFWDR